MFVKYFIASTIMFTARTLPNTTCNRIKINETWYEKEVILQNVGRPYHLVVHKSTNVLFFSYALPDTYADVDFQLAYIDLDTKEHQAIAGIRGGCSVAIDQANDDIYLGGIDGIYKYNVYTKLADFYREKDKNIWTLFFKDNLFYISYPEQKLFIELDGRFVRVAEFENSEIDNFHVTTDNEIYFTNQSGFYKLSGEGVVDSISDLLFIRQIVEDNEGVMYLCTNSGIYVRENGVFTKIVNLKSIFGLAFDRENSIIFSDEKNIIKLKTSDRGCENFAHW